MRADSMKRRPWEWIAAALLIFISNYVLVPVSADLMGDPETDAAVGIIIVIMIILIVLREAKKAKVVDDPYFGVLGRLATALVQKPSVQKLLAKEWETESSPTLPPPPPASAQKTKKQCPECNGSKVKTGITCDKCNGTGAAIYRKDSQEYSCDPCKGTGKITIACPTCKGTGEVLVP